MVLLYRKLLGKMLLFGAILFSLCMGIEYILYRNTQNDFYIRQADWHLKHPRPIQVLFLGNSRTGAHIYLPSIIKKWETTMYVLGVEGGGIEDFWRKFKVFAARNTLPKTVVLQFDPPALIDRRFDVDTFIHKERFLSYLLLNNLGINQWLSTKYGYEDYDAYIPLVRYIPYPEMLRMHLFKQASEPYNSPYEFYAKVKSLEGSDAFEPLKDYIHAPIFTRNLAFQYADSFYQYCQQNKVQLVGIYPPQSNVTYNIMQKKYRRTLDSFLYTHPNMPFNDFNTHEFAHDSLFRNHMHLNVEGVALYTNKLEEWLNAIGVKSRTSPDSLVWQFD